MMSMGKTVPQKVYSDAAPSFLTLNDSRQGAETSHLTDPEYLKLQGSLTKQGVQVVHHSAYSPYKTGKA